MTNTKVTAAITEESILDSKKLRDKMSDRIEVLEKVKQLFLIPEMECMTVKQVADYFEVNVDAVKRQYQRNQDEFDSDGTCIKSPSDLKSLSGTKSSTLKMAQRRGFLEITLDDNTTIAIPNCGVKCFPKRAVLRMGMLLRDSRIAKGIRTQLLNVFENTTTEQRTTEIDEEIGLLNNIGAAFGTGDTVKILQACMKLDTYRKRHIAEVEKYNAELERRNTVLNKYTDKLDKENDELAAKLNNSTNLNKELFAENQEISERNNDLVLENKVLAADILKWTDRASANRLIRVLAGSLRKGFSDTFNLVYHELLYKYSISLKARAKLRRTKHPLISYIRDDEWIYIYRVVAAICNKTHIDIAQLFKKAKIDVTTLDLSE